LKQKDNRKRTLEGLVKDAGQRGTDFVIAKEKETESSKELSGLYDNSLKAYYKEVKKVR
jgi:hypothetical protein